MNTILFIIGMTILIFGFICLMVYILTHYTDENGN